MSEQTSHEQRMQRIRDHFEDITTEKLEQNLSKAGLKESESSE